MADEKELEGWERSRAVHKAHADFYKLVGGLLGAGLVILVCVLIMRPKDVEQQLAFDLNLSTEFIGILVTVILVGVVNQWQAHRRYRQQLVDDAASTSNEIAKNAVYQIRRKGWLSSEDGLLREKDLAFANLQGVAFHTADLTGTLLYSANLEEALFNGACLRQAKLSGVNLRKASLFFTDLREVELVLADLQDASLVAANLQGAELLGTDLQGANLSHASLQGATLRNVKYDRRTILPDLTPWSSTTVMERFTESKHADFWQSPLAGSPAYNEGITRWLELQQIFRDNFKSKSAVAAKEQLDDFIRETKS